MAKLYIYEKINKIPLWISAKIKLTYIQLNKKKKFILINSPDHFNLGDHAITIAEHNFLNYYFPDISLFELSGYQCSMKGINISKYLSKNDIIMIQGGGYFGDLWPNEEKLVRDVIKNVTNNHIFILPQTIYYLENSDNTNSNRFLEFYEQFSHLVIMTRDQSSYDLLNNREKKEINEDDKNKGTSNGNSLYLLPDMVTFLKPKANVRLKRDGVLLCFRNDCEKIIPDSVEAQFNQWAQSRSINYTHIDTVIEKKNRFNLRISKKNRSKLMKRKLSEFASAQLIITDRLHGLLFAAITGTPCIAFNNISNKVQGVYKWIEYLPYIKLIDEKNFSTSILDMMLFKEPSQFDNTPLMRQFDRMADLIRVAL